jgi:hypothetical protein
VPAHAYVPPLLCTPMLVGGRGATFPSPDTNPSNGRRAEYACQTVPVLLRYWVVQVPAIAVGPFTMVRRLHPCVF